MFQQLTEMAHRLGECFEGQALVQNVQIDSRLVSSGSLFFALKGEKTDGHLFLREVAERGAIGAVVERGYSGDSFGLHLIRVPSVFDSLQLLAKRSIQESSCRIVGVTGSVGKTTTKEFIFTLLQGSFRVGKSPSNYNTQLTLPISILNREGGEELLVLEMGMSEPGEIGKLIAIAPPEVALLTQVALAHAASFPGGLEEIARNKGEIFSSTALKAAIYPAEISRFPEALIAAPLEKRTSFSLESKEADYFLSEQGIDERGVRIAPFTLPFRERHLRHNLCAAIAAVRQLGVSWEVIGERLAHLTLPKMRMERWQQGGITYINDAYNANPESMRAAFESVAAMQVGGRKIAVLGTMASLGAFSESSHQQIGEMAAQVFDILLLMGEEARFILEAFRKANKPAEFFADHKSLAKRLKELAVPGDLILIKGSRSMRMEEVYAALFD